MPSAIKKVLAVDAYVTDEFVKKSEQILALRQIQVHAKALEVHFQKYIYEIQFVGNAISLFLFISL